MTLRETVILGNTLTGKRKRRRPIYRSFIAVEYLDTESRIPVTIHKILRLVNHGLANIAIVSRDKTVVDRFKAEVENEMRSTGMLIRKHNNAYLVALRDYKLGVQYVMAPMFITVTQAKKMNGNDYVHILHMYMPFQTIYASAYIHTVKKMSIHGVLGEVPLYRLVKSNYVGNRAKVLVGGEAIHVLSGIDKPFHMTKTKALSMLSVEIAKKVGSAEEVDQDEVIGMIRSMSRIVATLNRFIRVVASNACNNVGVLDTVSLLYFLPFTAPYSLISRFGIQSKALDHVRRVAIKIADIVIRSVMDMVMELVKQTCPGKNIYVSRRVMLPIDAIGDTSNIEISMLHVVIPKVYLFNEDALKEVSE